MSRSINLLNISNPSLSKGKQRDQVGADQVHLVFLCWPCYRPNPQRFIADWESAWSFRCRINSRLKTDNLHSREVIMVPSIRGIAPGQVPPDTTEFLIVRHGETTWNADGRLQGQSESDLNEVGKEQAAAVAERLASGDLPFSALYTSDLRRAYETAVEISRRTGLEPVKVEGLRERHLGLLQGLTTAQARIAQPKAYAALASRATHLSIPGGGESVEELHERVAQTLEDIAQKHPGERVVVVSHGGVINAFHKEATNRSPPRKVVNASINTVQITQANTWTVTAWGDVRHLDNVGFQAEAFGGGGDSA